MRCRAPVWAAFLIGAGLLPSIAQSEEAKTQSFELWGRVEPAPEAGMVTLYGSLTPYVDSTRLDGKGRFRFKNLKTGPYTVAVFVPGVGEIRRTVPVGPNTADAKGRVEAVIPLEVSPEEARPALERRGRISAKELSIPEKAQSEYARAQRRLKENDIEGAIRHLEKAVELAPQFAAAWNHLGTIAYQTRRYRDAEKYFRRAIEEDPTAFEPVVNLGGALLSLEQFSEALPFNTYAVLQRPKDPLANSQLGMNYYYLGDPVRAERYLKLAKEIDVAHFSQPQLLLAEIYLRRGEREAAIAELEEFLRYHGDAENAPRVRVQLKLLRGR